MSDGDRQPRQLAVIHSYADLLRAVAAQSDARGMTHARLDSEAGLSDGHAGKLLSSRPAKRVGWVSLGRVMAALGLVLILVEECEAPPENASTDPSTPKPLHWRRRKGSAWGRRLAALRALSQTPEQRSASARKAALVRWSAQRQTNTGQT